MLLADAGRVLATGFQLGAATLSGFSARRVGNRAGTVVVTRHAIRLDGASGGWNEIELLQNTGETCQLAAGAAVGLDRLMDIGESWRHRNH